MLPIRKSSILAGTSAALLAIAGCSAGGDDVADGELDSVTIQLDYQVRGNHAMFFVADELGYFEEEDIEVDAINTGSGSPDALRLVGDGGADFGFADLPSLAISRSQGVQVSTLAAVNQSSPLGMCSLSKNLELSAPSDLQGKTVGVHPAGSTFFFYEALMAANNIDRERVEEKTVTPPYENYLMQNQVDAVVCYIDAEVPLLEKHAGGDDTLSILMGSENGYKAYGSGLFTTDEMIQDDPDLVQRFTNAYLRAFEYVKKKPEQASQVLADSSPELADNTELFTKQLQADIDHTFTSSTTESRGLGAMDGAMWKSTIETLTGQGVIKGTIPETSEVFDSTFVDAYYSD